MVMGRKPAVTVTAAQRAEAATRAVRYRSHWGLNQEQLASELGTHPSVVAGIERGSGFASTRFVAACLALDLATEPKDEAARRYRASRERQRADIERSAADAVERDAASTDTTSPPRVVDDKEYPF